MTTEFRLPEVGENIETGQVVKILVTVGNTIEAGQSVLELETDKAVVEVDTSVSGTIKEIHVSEGQEINVGQLILTVEADEEKLKPRREETAANKDEKEQRNTSKEADPLEREHKGGESVPQAETGEPSAADIQPEAPRVVAPAAPSVRRLARELGVDVGRVTGSGPGGRISAEDVKMYVRQINLDLFFTEQ